MDWNLLFPAAVWTAVVAAVLLLLRGQIARLIVRSLDGERPHVLDLIIESLDSKAGRARIRVVLDDMYAQRIAENDRMLHEAIVTANANRDSLVQVVESQKLQGHNIADVQGKMHELPRITDALEALARSTQAIGEQMQAVNISMARIDEREKERDRERRWHQTHPHPQRREDDST